MTIGQRERKLTSYNASLVKTLGGINQSVYFENDICSYI